jgi:hypothetical protein
MDTGYSQQRANVRPILPDRMQPERVSDIIDRGFRPRIALAFSEDEPRCGDPSCGCQTAPRVRRFLLRAAGDIEAHGQATTWDGSEPSSFFLQEPCYWEQVS